MPHDARGVRNARRNALRKVNNVLALSIYRPSISPLQLEVLQQRVNAVFPGDTTVGDFTRPLRLSSSPMFRYLKMVTFWYTTILSQVQSQFE